MNITGAPMYSKEVGAMRNPVSHTDTLQKLVFVFPFGIDQSLANVPFNTYVKGDADTISDAIRSFFSISVLKEIFTSNALNLVTMASTYERFKKQGPGTDVLVTNLLRGESPYASSYSTGNNAEYEIPQVDSVTLQSKINQKFSVIKTALKSDQRLKKLLPFMEVITLRNMLDVPVITGTFPFQLDTAALFTLLAAAIATRTKLENWSDVKRVISKLHTMSDLTVYQIFEVLANVESGGKDVPSFFKSTDLPGGSPTKLETLRNQAAQEEDPNKKALIQQSIDSETEAYAVANVRNLKDTKMKELERNMMFMMDPERLLVRFGLGNVVSQAKYAATKVSPQVDMMFSRTKQQFLEFLGGADSLFSSTYMLLSPIVPTEQGWGVTYMDMKQDMVNFILDNYDVFMNDLSNYFSTTIEKEIGESAMTIANMNKSCTTAKEDFISIMNIFNRTMSNAQVYPTFGLQDVQRFSDAVDSVVGKFQAVKKNTEDSLVKFFGRDTMIKVNTAIENLLINIFDRFFTKFNMTADPTSKLQAKIFAISSGNLPDEHKQQLHNKFLLSISEATQLILHTTFLMIFKLNLCEFLEVADVEFGVAKTDVLDLPNYCLVLPLEIINALYILYTKRNWKEAVIKSGSTFNPLNSSNIKGVVKLLRKQLGIPNLVVFDKKKNEVYYNFRYLGDTTEKIKMTALEVFVRAHLNDASAGVSQVYY